MSATSLDFMLKVYRFPKGLAASCPHPLRPARSKIKTPKCPPDQSCCGSSSPSRQTQTNRPMPNYQVQSPRSSWSWLLPYRIEGMPIRASLRSHVEGACLTVQSFTGGGHPPQTRPHDRHLRRPSPRQPQHRLPQRQRGPAQVLPRTSDLIPSQIWPIQEIRLLQGRRGSCQ